MADKDLSSTQVGATKEKRSGACKRHCAQWWWLHLIIFVVGAVVLVVVAIFAVTPRIAQDKIDAANLDIQAVSISNPTPNGFHMKIDSTITTDGQVKANIDAFQGAMYLKDSDKPFLNLPFPETNANKFQTVNVSADVTIADMDEFVKFNTVFISNETVTIVIKGYTYVQPKGLSKKYGVNFIKYVDFKGLNLFKGNKVIDATSNLADNKYPNFNATAQLPNPSYYTIDLGNVTFTNFAPDGSDLGLIHVNNFFLQPGMNNVAVKGNLSLGPVATIAANKSNCNKDIAFKLKGKDVDYNGKNISYFAQALYNAPQTVEINLTEVGKTDPQLNSTIALLCASS